MDRSSPELCFGKFLQGAEESAGADNRSSGDDLSEVQAVDEGLRADGDPSEYAVMLKKKLDIYCAVVAKSRASQESSSLAESGTTTASQLVSQASFNANEIMNNNSGGTNSYSSEGDPETENTRLENTEQTNEKKTRRMLSNRESARRSRKRKQVHLTDLESQVSQLRVENTSLIKRLSEMTHNYNDASVGNRVLKSDIETLKAKVKMAEETVKRVTNMCDMSAMSMSFSINPISDASVPQKEQNINITPHFSHHQNSNMRGENHGIEIPVSDLSNGRMKRSGSVRRVASLEMLQTKMCVDQWEAATWHDDETPVGGD
ncbi:hypothetical protein LUZ60_005343 [Juncus effusus]|nr:hypothetical protein LUZ60_005343 [Juncus effusus]